MMSSDTFTQKLIAFLEFKKLPRRLDINEVVPTADPCVSSVQTYYLPGSHGEVRFRIYAQCATYKPSPASTPRELLILSCVSKLIQTPVSLKEEMLEVVNCLNKEVIERSWMVYYGLSGDKVGTTEFRLTLVMFDGAWSKIAFNETLNSEIIHLSDQFNLTLSHLIAFFTTDQSFSKRQATFRKTQSYLSRFTPLTSLHGNFVYDVTEAAFSLLKQSRAKSDCSLFSIGVVTFEEEVITQEGKVAVKGKVLCDLGCVEIRAEFLTEKGNLTFSNLPQAELNIAQVNFTLPLGHFLISPTGYLSFSLKGLHCCLDKRDRPTLTRTTIDYFLSILKETLPAFTEQQNESFSMQMERSPRVIGSSQVELTDRGIKIAGKKVVLLQEKVPKKLFGTFMLKSGQFQGENYYVKVEGMTKLERPLSPEKEAIARELFESLAREGVFFSRFPLHLVYFQGSSAKIVPNFNAADITPQAFQKDYQSALTSAFSSLQLATPPPDLSIASISPRCLSEPQRLADPTRELFPSSQLYSNMLGSQPVILHKISIKACENIGRLMGFRHPSLARVYGFISTDEGKFLVREKGVRRLMDGFVEQQVSMLLRVAEGLAFLHANEEYHLRLKPENVLFTSDNRTIVSDFGLFVHETEFRLSRDQFSDPDLLMKRKSLDKEKADVWSFGMLMQWVLVGRRMFEAYSGGQEWDKEAFVREVGYKYRRPLIKELFERKNPKLVLLMRSCLYPEARNRPNMSQIIRTLEPLEGLAG